MQLHRADVLDAAIRLLDAEGLDRLTMRRLATTLNVQAGALYHHFADKKALLDAMAERLLDDIDDIDPAAPWDQRVTELSSRLRDALRAHRDGARLHAGTFVAQPNTLRTGQAFLHAFLDAGLPRDQAGTTVFALLYYILGHTIEEQARDELITSGHWPPRPTPETTSEYPDIVDVAASLNAASASQRFHDGLTIFLDGVRTRAAAAATS